MNHLSTTPCMVVTTQRDADGFDVEDFVQLRACKGQQFFDGLNAKEFLPQILETLKLLGLLDE